MINDENSQYTEWDVEVAKRIACAVTSYQANVSFESLWEQHNNPQEAVGTFWLSIAKHIREGMPNKGK